MEAFIGPSLNFASPDVAWVMTLSKTYLISITNDILRGKKDKIMPQDLNLWSYFYFDSNLKGFPPVPRSLLPRTLSRALSPTLSVLAGKSWSSARSPSLITNGSISTFLCLRRFSTRHFIQFPQQVFPSSSSFPCSPDMTPRVKFRFAGYFGRVCLKSSWEGREKL